MSFGNLGRASGAIDLDARPAIQAAQQAAASLRGIDQAADAATRGLTSAATAGSRLGGALTSPIRAAGGLVTALGQIGLAAIGMQAAARAAVGLTDALVGVGADFEATMSGVKAVAGATADEFRQLSDLALQLGADTAFSATEAAGAMEELVKGGISVRDIMEGAAEATLNLAAAGGVQLTEAATIAANAINQFRLSGEDMAHVADLIAGAANASSLGVQDFGYALAQAGAVANTVGFTFDDLAVAIAAMGQAGIIGSDAGTSLRTMMLNLQPQTKQQIKLFRELGLITEDGANAFFTAEGRVKSMIEVADVLNQALGDMTEQQRLAALEVLFGSDAIRAAAVLARQGAAGLRELNTEMANVAAADVAATRLDNLRGDLEALSGSWETLRIRFGESLTPALRIGVQGLDRFIDGLTQQFAGIAPALQTSLRDAMDMVRIFGAFLQTGFQPVEQGSPLFDATIDRVGRLANLLRSSKDAVDSFIGGLRGDWQVAPGIERFHVIAGELGRLLRTGVIDSVLTFIGALQGTWEPAPGITDFHLLVGQIGTTIREDVAPLVEGFIATIAGIPDTLGTLGTRLQHIDAFDGLLETFGAVKDSLGPLAREIGTLVTTIVEQLSGEGPQKPAHFAGTFTQAEMRDDLSETNKALALAQNGIVAALTAIKTASSGVAEDLETITQALADINRELGKSQAGADFAKLIRDIETALNDTQLALSNFGVALRRLIDPESANRTPLQNTIVALEAIRDLFRVIGSLAEGVYNILLGMSAQIILIVQAVDALRSGDLDTAKKKIEDIYDLMLTPLPDVDAKVGLIFGDKEAFAELERVGKLTKDLDGTTLKLGVDSNAPEITNDINQLKGAADAVPKEIIIDSTADTSDPQQQIAALDAAAKGANQTITIRGEAETSSAQAELAQLQLDIASMPSSFTVTADVDTTIAKQQLAGLAAMLPHSPAKEGPLAFTPDWDFIAGNLDDVLAGMVGAVQRAGRQIVGGLDGLRGQLGPGLTSGMQAATAAATAAISAFLVATGSARSQQALRAHAEALDTLAVLGGDVTAAYEAMTPALAQLEHALGDLNREIDVYEGRITAGERAARAWEQRLDAMRAGVDELSDALDEAERAMRDAFSAPLKGEFEQSQKIFGLENALNILQLQRLKLLESGAREDDKRVKALDEQIAAHERALEIARLEEKVRFEGDRNQLARQRQAIEGREEVSVEEALQRAGEAADEAARLRGELSQAEQTLAHEERLYQNHLDWLEKQRGELDAIEEQHDNIARLIQLGSEQMQQMVGAARALNQELDQIAARGGSLTSPTGERTPIPASTETHVILSGGFEIVGRGFDTPSDEIAGQVAAQLEGPLGAKIIGAVGAALTGRAVA